MNRNNIDMLNGSIVDKLLIFALPLAATGMLQQLFNAVDVAVVGRFVGKYAMAAVGSNSALIGLLVTGFIGVSLGVNVVISIATGRGNMREVSDAVHTAILFSLLGGIGATVLGEIFAEPVLKLMGVPDRVFDMALCYLRIYLLGMPVIFLYNFESAIFRSQGDTKTPLAVLVISGIANVLLNLFFVCVLGMDADGVATATILSNLISSVVLFILLCRRNDRIRVTPKEIRIYGKTLKEIIRIGLPAGLQSMVFSFSNILIQSAINSLGSDVMAASSASFVLEILIYYLCNSFGQACTTFVGQNYGADNIPRAREITRKVLILDISVTAAASMLMILAGKTLLGLFNTDETIIELGFIRLCCIMIPEILTPFMEVMSGAMRGYGYSLLPAIITFVGVCGIRIAWVFTVFKMSPTFGTLMSCYGVTWGVTAAGLVIAYLLFIRDLTKNKEAS